MRKGMSIIAMAITLTVTACHRQGDSEPLARQTIYCWDKFFDVEALVAGYGGKLLETTDDGLTFHRQPTGTDRALYDIAAMGDRLWIIGQEGLIIHSSDGGKSWNK